MINKKGAIELSFSTIIIIAIGSVLLILGLVFVKNIFDSSRGAIDLIDKNTKSQINQLFNQDEDLKTIVYLPNRAAELKKGKSGIVSFGIKNTARGETTAGKFSYQVRALEVEPGCRGLSLQQANDMIKLGKSSGTFELPAGDRPKEFEIILEAPQTAPLCFISYDINVKKDGQTYDTNTFSLKITS
jgi:hypothetical protein